MKGVTFQPVNALADSNGLVVHVGDRQAESLDEPFEVKAETEFSFVKLMPLVGG